MACWELEQSLQSLTGNLFVASFLWVVFPVFRGCFLSGMLLITLTELKVFNIFYMILSGMFSFT